MSGSVGSAFPDQNILFNAASGGATAAVQNQLLQNQMQQQSLGEHEQEMMARAASGLLTIPDETARAAAYPQAVADLQRYGLARNAPSVYPGEAALRRVAAMGTPSTTLYTYGQNQAANAAILGAGGTGGTGGTGGATTPPPSAPGTGATIGQRQNNPGNLTFAGQPGASPGQGNRFASFPDMATGVAANANQLALYQTQHGINTVRGAVTRWVGDPKADLTSYTADIARALGVGPDDPIDLTNPDVQAKFIQAQFPHESAGGGYVLNPADVQKGVQLAAAQRGQRVQVAAAPPVTTAATAPPQARPGAPPAPPPTQFAGPGAPPPPSPTAPPQAIGTQGLVRNADGSVGTPNAGGLAAPPPQPQQQAQQQPPPLPQPTAPPPPGTLPFQPVQPTLALPAMDAENLTAQDRASLNALGRAPGTTPQQLLERKTALQNVNQQRTKDAQAQATQQLDQQIKIYQLNNPGVDVQMTGQGMVVLRKDTGQVVQVYPFAPNIRSTVVEGVGPEGQPGHYLYQGANRGDFVPQAQEPPQAGYTVRKEAYARDSGQINDYAKTGQMAQADQVRLQEMQDSLDRITTGPGTATKVAMQAWLNTYLPNMVNPFSKQTEGMSDAAAAEVFNKFAFRNATSQERQTLGARGGAMATKMFIQSNPGLELLTDANQRMLSVMKIANQADIDYTQGAQNHFTSNEQRFQDSNGKEYTSLAAYDRDWQQQRNPQVYAGAAGALAGMPARNGEVNGVKQHGWAEGLSDAEYERALNIVSRANPDAVVNGKTGRLSMQPANTQSATPPGTTGAAAAQPGVIRYDHTGRRIGG